MRLIFGYFPAFLRYASKPRQPSIQYSRGSLRGDLIERTDKLCRHKRAFNSCEIAIVGYRLLLIINLKGVKDPGITACAVLYIPFWKRDARK